MSSPEVILRASKSRDSDTDWQGTAQYQHKQIQRAVALINRWTRLDDGKGFALELREALFGEEDNGS